MLDGYISAMNTQNTAAKFINEISDNLMNYYNPGYQEKKVQFLSFLDGSVCRTYTDPRKQGKAIPALADENLYIEGRGYFALRNKEGKITYTRLGNFKFDGNGVLRSSSGEFVQGYLVNDNGEIMNGVQGIDAAKFAGEEFASASVPTAAVKLWIDPSNGKFLGKYEEFEFKEDGMLYGKADKGKISVPLYKIPVINFNSPENLFDIGNGQYIETEESGKAVIGNAKVRGKALEQSTVDFTAASNWYQQAQFQLSVADMITKSHRTLLEQVMGLMGQ